MPGIIHLIGGSDCFAVELGEREATPEPATKPVSARLYYHFYILYLLHIILTSIAVDSLFATGSRKRTYSHETTQTALTETFPAEFHEKQIVDDTIFPVDGAPWLPAAYRRLELRFQHVTCRNPNAAKRIFRELEQLTNQFLYIFSHVNSETVENYSHRLNFCS